MRSVPIAATLLLACLLAGAQAPKQDRAVYQENVLQDREKQEEEARVRWLAAQKGAAYAPEAKPPKMKFLVDLSGIDRPQRPGEFKQAWHFPPKRQWWTNTCWCFSTTSFLESEIKRIHGREVKLSEMYTVYWDYVEKVREFVRTRGTSLVDEGSEANSVLLRWKQYGIVRESDYPGLQPGTTAFNHEPLFQEIRSYCDYLKKNQIWNEEQATASVRLILDKHLGAPPKKVAVEGKELTPRQFLHEVVGLDLDAYVAFMSFMYAPFWTRAEYKVPDNWWHGADYLNVPLVDWYGAIKGASKAGYSVCIWGDVSEPGYQGATNVAMVPSFDIPAAFIDQSSREMRFVNHATEDDHGIHIVGYQRRGDQDWFLVKDSARSSHRGVPGYYFYREDYVKLKMLGFMAHKDAVKDLLARFEKASAAAAKP